MKLAVLYQNTTTKQT